MNNHINFQSIEAPFIHFTNDRELFEQLYQQLSEKSSNESFLTTIDGKECSNKAALFNTFSSKLQFPDYFGNNWDALNDCLNDLSWLNSNQFVLFIRNFEEMLTQNQGDLMIFLEILEDAMKDWNAGADYDIERQPMPFHLVIHSNTNIVAELSSKLQELEVNVIGVVNPEKC